MPVETTGAEEVAWDLTDLFEGPQDPRLGHQVNETLSAARAFRSRYHGRVAELGAGELAAATAELEDLQSLLVRLETFAFLHFSTDTSDPTRGALLQRMQELGTAFSTEVLFFGLEWVGIEEQAAARLLADPAIRRYRHHLESARRYRPHLLSEPEEKLLAEKSLSASAAWARLFTELTSALRIEVGDEQLSLEEVLSRLQRAEPEVRRGAAEGLSRALDRELRTRSFIFNTLLLDKATDDRLRAYPSWLAARNLSNEASDESVAALVDAVVARYDIPQRYYRLKAKLLGVDQLFDYDRMAPIGDTSERVPWDQARRIVEEAYSSFSPVTGEIVSDFFDRRWIDGAPRPHKQAGAFCATTVPGLHPYVLLSYTGERRSVLTLAHELGHGVHGVLAAGQGLLNAETPLTLAETASVFGEALTFRRLMSEETDPKDRLELLAGRLEDAIATVFRQVAMNRFEDAIHNARRSEGELSPEAFNDRWLDTQATMLGEAVHLTEGYRSWWSYVHHFVGAPGYVYAYAFGYLFSLAIYRRYEQEGSSIVDSYLDLLRAGGSDRPEVLAGIVGLDLADPGFWAGGLETIDRLVTEAEDLAGQIG